jgi:hypothetical protein
MSGSGPGASKLVSKQASKAFIVHFLISVVGPSSLARLSIYIYMFLFTVLNPNKVYVLFVSVPEARGSSVSLAPRCRFRVDPRDPALGPDMAATVKPAHYEISYVIGRNQTGNCRFGASGWPRRPQNPSEKVGGKAPPPFQIGSGAAGAAQSSKTDDFQPGCGQ